jgi:hypothetical protein
VLVAEAPILVRIGGSRNTQGKGGYQPHRTGGSPPRKDLK